MNVYVCILTRQQTLWNKEAENAATVVGQNKAFWL